MSQTTAQKVHMDNEKELILNELKTVYPKGLTVVKLVKCTGPKQGYNVSKGTLNARMRELVADNLVHRLPNKEGRRYLYAVGPAPALNNYTFAYGAEEAETDKSEKTETVEDSQLNERISNIETMLSNICKELDITTSTD